jgi:hypothetical protein
LSVKIIRQNKNTTAVNSNFVLHAKLATAVQMMYLSSKCNSEASLNQGRDPTNYFSDKSAR